MSDKKKRDLWTITDLETVRDPSVQDKMEWAVVKTDTQSDTPLLFHFCAPEKDEMGYADFFKSACSKCGAKLPPEAETAWHLLNS